MNNHQAMLAETTESVVCQKLVDGHFIRAEARVVVERELPVFLNGKHLITASITTGMEREFVTGYLFGQGFMESAAELESIHIEDNAARVLLKDTRKASQIPQKTEYRIVTGGGSIAFFDAMNLPEIKTRLKIGKKEIFKAMNTVFEKAEIYPATEGAHASGLFTPEATPICIAEDIGRHNTLDKVIGYALIHKIDCRRTFLASTGRMASEMVTKICRAGIPVVATKTAVTQSGLEIGKKCGLTMIGFVRDTGNRINTDMEVRIIMEPGMKIYTHAERISGE
jgi:FdhD protein